MNNNSILFDNNLTLLTPKEPKEDQIKNKCFVFKKPAQSESFHQYLNYDQYLIHESKSDGLTVDFKTRSCPEGKLIVAYYEDAQGTLWDYPSFDNPKEINYQRVPNEDLNKYPQAAQQLIDHLKDRFSSLMELQIPSEENRSNDPIFANFLYQENNLEKTVPSEQQVMHQTLSHQTNPFIEPLNSFKESVKEIASINFRSKNPFENFAYQDSTTHQPEPSTSTGLSSNSSEINRFEFFKTDYESSSSEKESDEEEKVEVNPGFIMEL